ncbi:MAG: GntP family permease [Clostridium sp.]|uniref:GntP family permease n=1 Tax=Clostridium sp. TaxID=1506 RepID=UPI0025BA7C41|nr:Na+/H+ antiporter NhaC family protein [Clostridium sp.]MCE5219787.1 GntP family permease [Clostridium sp.]
MPVIHWIGAVIGLIIAIVLIFKKVNPVYALFVGAILGGVVGGASVGQTVDIIIDGTNSVMGAVVRVIAAGVLAGILIESGAAEKIAETIVESLGEKKALIAIALATMIITAVGVFITVSVIIVAPIAISVGRKVGVSKTAIFIAMVGGGKAGNMISPNANTISAAKGFNIDLASVMIAGFIPAVAGLIVTFILASLLSNKGVQLKEIYSEVAATSTKERPSLSKAIVAPIVAIVLLGINPVSNILHVKALMAFNIDSMIILPVAGIVGLLAMGKANKIIAYTTSGLNKMTDTVMLLIGGGAIAGIVSKSDLGNIIVASIKAAGISGTFLAPIAGIFMGGAMAATSTGVVVASGTFGKAILSMGISPLGAAVMVNTGATVLDHLPHGGFFHSTREAVKMNIKESMKMIPFESIVGLTMTIVATIIYGFLR